MQPSDFQGIIKLDQSIIEQLSDYLQEKESQVGNSILHAIHPLPKETLPPVLPFSTLGHIKLSDAVEAFSKNVYKIRSSARPLVPANDWEIATRHINNAFWEYVEVLEGCVTELFQQLSQVGFEQWQPELMKVVDSVKDILNLRLEDLTWQIRRMESLLWEYRWACEDREGRSIFFKKILFFWKHLLDRSLVSYLHKSKKFLHLRYSWFSDRYSRYRKLKARIGVSLRKFTGYQVLKSLENGVQNDFQNLYRLLKLWRLNTKSKSLPLREPIRALRSLISMEKATHLFSEYYSALKAALFERSRECKREPRDFYTKPSNRRVAQDAITGCRAELRTLGATIAKYREFFLRTHPNPYIRTRWGFVEWIVGPEPVQTKELLHLVYEVENLDKLFEGVGESLKKAPSPSDGINLSRKYQELQHTLHEMGQPLTSRIVMRGKAEKALALLEEMNELGSYNPKVIDYVGKAFSRALRADWQYQVLFEIPLFHQLYSIHQGVLGPIEDREHLSRVNKFQDLIGQITKWVNNRDTYRHVHEIETDITDMKNCMQDFLAFVQRIAKDRTLDKSKAGELVTEIAKQLLVYRYVFGKFFHYLHQHEPEGKLIRNQCLFVDQYFESVENKLHEMRIRQSGSRQ
ncbi:MAG: hypothetical protein WB791_02395 [Waddliaceae bacterium]